MIPNSIGITGQTKIPSSTTITSQVGNEDYTQIGVIQSAMIARTKTGLCPKVLVNPVMLQEP